MTSVSPLLAPSRAGVLPWHWLLRGVALVLGVGALIFVNGLLQQYITKYAIYVIGLCCVNIVVAVSLNLINGITGQFSLGHAGFMAIGGYVSGYVSRDIGPQLPFIEPVVFAISLLLAAIAAGLAGLVVGLPSLRLRGDYLAIVTLGFGQIIVSILRTIKFQGGNTFIADVPATANFVWTAGAAIGCILTVRALADSSFGRGMRAVREDEIAAEASGINTTRVKVTAFVISAMWAGVAGGLLVSLQHLANPEDFRFDRSVEAVAMVVLGGLGSITGVTLAAILITVLREVLVNPVYAVGAILLLIAGASALSLNKQRARGGAWVGRWAWPPLLSLALTFAFWRYLSALPAPQQTQLSGLLRFVILALILIVLMLLRPQGLLGRSEFSFAALRRGKREPVDEGIKGTL